ncbi:unnamed protein product [Enterobius vermicularis]|uniref:Secreted protein n=1 Tax=Enterobius vermicularis TaxID=51028 RepID=A0A0N4UVR0_ENTVE|nr:unnamed protein product [Enterobius vermicularis]
MLSLLFRCPPFSTLFARLELFGKEKINDFGGCDGVGVGVGDDGDGYDDGGNGGDGVQCKHSMHLNGLRLQ